MGARTYWVAPVPPLLYGSGAAQTSASAIADISPAPSPTLYPGILELGTTVRLYAQGELTTGTTADTLTIGFYYGGSVSGVALASTATTPVTVSLSGTGETSVPWEMFYQGTIRSLGTSGTILGMGHFYAPNVVGTPLSQPYSIYPIPQTLALRTATINTTTANAITAGALWTAATGSPSITCYALEVELLG
jgi:hypothetical protein